MIAVGTLDLTKFVILIFFLNSCATYVLPVPNAERQKPARIVVTQDIQTLSQKIESHLRRQNHLQSKTQTGKKESRFISPWIRDSSLRYYVRFMGNRLRHLSTWKAQWTLREIDARHSEIEVTVLEIIFVGHPADAGPGPDLDNKSNWFETDPDHLRAALLLRRFWTENFTLASLPPEISNITVPDINFAPLGADLRSRPQKNYARPKSF